MRTFFAIQQDKTFNPGWQQCLSWAHLQIKGDITAIQLLTARGSYKEAVIIAEITTNSERMIEGGRTLAVVQSDG